MPWPVHPNGLLGAQGDQDTYRIERSLRFNSADSAYLNRTFSGTPYTYTLSWWVKRGTLSVDQIIFGSRQGASNPSYVEFLANNTITITLGVSSTVLTTSMVFRDPSAWYHFVLSVTPSATSYFYVNGTQVGSWTSSATPYLFNSAYTNAIGRYGDSASFYFDGYMAEINFIDGQALTPSSFGETDAITGRWKAKAYSGTYGTNGFYLKFADNSGTTSTTLGKDSSGNGNNWTPNNFSVTAGAGNDSLVDSPTNYGADTGVGGEVRGNYATLNPLFGTVNTIQDGNLVLTGNSAGFSQRVGTMAVSSGKWYYEVTLTTLPANMDPLVGFTEINNASAVSQYTGQASSSYAIWQYSGNTFLQKVNSGVFTNTNTSVAVQGDTLGVALDLDAGRIWFSKNGVWVDGGNPASGTDAQFTGLTGTFAPAARGTGGANTITLTFNFGQRPFAYTAPAGFRSLCTTNLPKPTIQKPSSAMDVVTYTGNGSARSITGLGFSPDLVWIKGRSGATDHAIYDSVRGVQLDLASNLTSAETTQSQGVTAFNSDGFSIGTLAKINTNTSTYIAWAWDEAPIAGMDIVSFTAPSGTSQSTVAHSLGVAPKMIIVKDRNNSATNWPVFHASVCDTTSKFLRLNTTDALGTFSTIWGANLPTASVFGVTGSAIAASGSSCIAYLFAEVEGFSKFGSYTGNGSSDGPFVWCGFRPRWVLTKNASTGAAGYDWMIWDTSRDSFNEATKVLSPDLSNAEYSTSIDALSNGFKMRNSGATANANGSTHIFAAFAEFPFKYARAR